MEILKFDEAGSSSPSRKRSGRGAILVTFVALVFGAGTALASGTLAINTDNTIALDQGVANSVQCDDQIDVTLLAPYNTTAEDFLLTGVSIAGINDASDKCLGKWFKIRVYDSNGSPSVFCNTSTDTSVNCAIDDDGTYAKLQVTSTTLNFTFTQGMRTGEPDPSWSPSPSPSPTNTPQPRLVRVKNVTVESSDI
jgi:hypothetical protein